MKMKCPKCQYDNPETQRFCGECGTQIGSSEDIEVSHTKTLETPVEELTRGTVFADRYEIIEELGKGGMGKVYRVEDKKTGEELALKLIKPEISADKKTIERFSNELKLAHKISHRNVCRMFHLGEEKGVHYITMEYVPGEDLKSFLRRSRRLDTGTAVSISKQVCEGLTEAHRFGVVHRDLKPSNIMVDKEGNARIMDFGIARAIKTKGITGAGIMVGTPEYMSPEQAEAKEVDHRSDIYSMGAILYEMVTGQLPFEGDTPLSIAMKHKGEEPKDPRALNPQIPEDLSQLILKCMEKDKESRYQSAEELHTELDNIEKGIPTTQREVVRKKPITSKEITVTFRLKKLLIPALVVIAVIVVALVIWQLLPQKEALLAPKIDNSIAVISFENQTGDTAYDYLQKAIPNLLITNIENTGFLYVATWERMYDLLKQMGKKDAVIIDRELGFELCRREGIEAIVLGSFVKAGDVFVTDVKVLDAETKELIKSASSKGKGVDSILETQIDELSREISEGIGISKERIEKTQLRITEVTTKSMDAYNYFLRGTEELERHYWDNARRYLEKSIEMDPTFALAYRYLGEVFNWFDDIKARNEAYEKAKLYSQNATEKERLYIEASYAEAIEGNAEHRISILKQIAEKYPREKKVHTELALYHYFRRSYNNAIIENNKTLELDPSYGKGLNILAYIYAEMGDFEKAIEYEEKYVAVSPGDANPLDSMGDVYRMMGKIDEALTKYKEALEVKPDFGFTGLKIGYIYALKEDYSEASKWIDQYIVTAASPGLKAIGFYWKSFLHYWLANQEQSMLYLRRMDDIAEAIGNELLKARVQWMRGWIHYDRGEYEFSRECFKTWFNSLIEYDASKIMFYQAFYNLALGLVDLKQGRIDSAKTRLDEMNTVLQKIQPPFKYLVRFNYDLFHGDLLLAEGHIDKAIEICEKASPLGRYSAIPQIVLYNMPFLKDVLARAHQKMKSLDKAIAEYERLITFDPSRDEKFLIHPLYYYRLARLYEEKGSSGRAIEQYEKFLELWKNADSGILDVDDAKKRLAELRK